MTFTTNIQRRFFASLAVLFFMTFQQATAQTNWTVDTVHSKVGFSVTHLVISEVEGKFEVYDGSTSSSREDFVGADIKFSVNVASVDTDNSMRDDHLKSEDFFNAASYPKMTFESTSFKKKGNNTYTLKGNLTIKNITKPVTFEVTLGGIVNNDGYGNTKAGFKATTTINRFDYGLKWNVLTEAGGMTVGDMVTIDLNLQFVKGKKS